MISDQLSAEHYEIVFYMVDAMEYVVRLVESKGYHVINRNPSDLDNSQLDREGYNEYDNSLFCSQDAPGVIDVLSQDEYCYVIVDHYMIDATWHVRIEAYCDKLIVIDDLANKKYSCDVLINQSACDSSIYSGLVPDYSILLVGQEYALLRDEFIDARERALRHRSNTVCMNKIMVSFGGTDPEGLTVEVLSTIVDKKLYDRYSFYIVVTSGFSELKKIEEISRNYNGIQLCSDVDNVSDVIVECDIAIGSSGVSALERCVLGLPSIIISSSNNQLGLARLLEESSSAVILDRQNIDSDLLFFIEFLGNNSLWARVSENAASLLDGVGARLVCALLKTCNASDGRSVLLRKLGVSDVQTTYLWQRNPLTRKYFNNSDIPSYREHAKWLRKAVSDGCGHSYMIMLGMVPVGVVRVDKYHEGYIVSIYVDQDYCRMNISFCALRYIKRVFYGFKLFAKIDPDNLASVKLFSKSGFVYDGSYMWRASATS